MLNKAVTGLILIAISLTIAFGDGALIWFFWNLVAPNHKIAYLDTVLITFLVWTLYVTAIETVALREQIKAR